MAALAAFSALSSDQSISIIIAGAIFFALMWAVVSTAPSAELRSRNLVFALWWVLLGSEAIFSYITDDAEGGQFSSGAYSEAMMWVFIGLVFLIYTYRHSGYLRTLFTGSYFVVRGRMSSFLRLRRAPQLFDGVDRQVVPRDPIARRMQL
jgi:hypothetical protein